MSYFKCYFILISSTGGQTAPEYIYYHSHYKLNITHDLPGTSSTNTD